MTEKEVRKKIRQSRLDQQPGFFHAVSEDLHCASFHRGEFFDTRVASGWYVAYRALVLMFVADSFFAQVCYRASISMRAKGIRILPRILHKIAIITGQVAIDEFVIMHPGVYIPHGQVAIGGVSEIKSGCYISPWITVGLQPGNINGPTIGHGVFIGTGVKLLGEFTVGDDVVIGAQALVMRDVPAGATVAGIPAKQVGNK